MYLTSTLFDDISFIYCFSTCMKKRKTIDVRNQYGNLFFLFIIEQNIFNEKGSFSGIEIIASDHHLTKIDLEQIVEQDFQRTNDTVEYEKMT